VKLATNIQHMIRIIAEKVFMVRGQRSKIRGHSEAWCTFSAEEYPST